MPGARADKAEHLAASAHMAQQDIPAAPFLLRSYQRWDKASDKVATFYIEGDGLAWLDRRTPSGDPTPLNPMALKLAIQDDAPNVVYLARPCQYTKMLNGTLCPPQNWLSARFSPNIVAAMNDAIDSIKRQHAIEKINLVGYSGGGAIAILLTARRDDVLTLRTVAGNLDTDSFTRIHKTSPLAASLNPASVAQKISTIPQLHFIGGQDEIVPLDIFTDFQRHMTTRTGCVGHIIVPTASHDEGWVERWRILLKQPVMCHAPLSS